MINTSRLYTFIDQNKEFSLSYLDGQKIIYDLTLDFFNKPHYVEFYRSIILDSLLLSTFLKNFEQLGFYIDSVNPAFMFKLEFNAKGNFRHLLRAESDMVFPKLIQGKTRLIKSNPSNLETYQSVVEINNLSPEEITQEIINTSYQLLAKPLVFKDRDQSCLVHALGHGASQEKFEQFTSVTQQKLAALSIDTMNDTKNIIDSIEKLGFIYLSSKEISFQCSCSLENMISGVRSLSMNDLNYLFEEKDSLEIKCDYCHKEYAITKENISSP